MKYLYVFLTITISFNAKSQHINLKPIPITISPIMSDNDSLFYSNFNIKKMFDDITFIVDSISTYRGYSFHNEAKNLDTGFKIELFLYSGKFNGVRHISEERFSLNYRLVDIYKNEIITQEAVSTTSINNLIKLLSKNKLVDRFNSFLCINTIYLKEKINAFNTSSRNKNVFIDKIIIKNDKAAFLSNILFLFVNNDLVNYQKEVVKGKQNYPFNLYNSELSKGIKKDIVIFIEIDIDKNEDYIIDIKFKGKNIILSSDSEGKINTITHFILNKNRIVSEDYIELMSKITNLMIDFAVGNLLDE
jgi:hypothetical protein